MSLAWLCETCIKLLGVRGRWEETCAACTEGRCRWCGCSVPQALTGFKTENANSAMPVIIGSRKRIVLESPFSPSNGRTTEQNKEYLAQCMLDSLERGEAPFPSHALYPQVLDDTIPEQRRMGMESGFAFGDTCAAVIAYVDWGVSSGMIEGIRRYLQNGAVLIVRCLFRGVTEDDYRFVRSKL